MFEKIAERRIRDAMERGEFENLEGKGRPLVFEDDSFIPPDLRMAYKVLKNAGFLPPELLAEKEIHEVEDLIAHLEDEEERYRQMKKLNLLITKANMMRQRPIDIEKHQVYYRKVVERVTVRKRKRGRG